MKNILRIEQKIFILLIIIVSVIILINNAEAKGMIPVAIMHDNNMAVSYDYCDYGKPCKYLNYSQTGDYRKQVSSSTKLIGSGFIFFGLLLSAISLGSLCIYIFNKVNGGDKMIKA